MAHQVAAVSHDHVQDRRLSDSGREVFRFQERSGPQAGYVDVHRESLDPLPDLGYLDGDLVGLHPAEGRLGLRCLDGLARGCDLGLLQRHGIVQCTEGIGHFGVLGLDQLQGLGFHSCPVLGGLPAVPGVSDGPGLT